MLKIDKAEKSKKKKSKHGENISNDAVTDQYPVKLKKKKLHKEDHNSTDDFVDQPRTSKQKTSKDKAEETLKKSKHKSKLPLHPIEEDLESDEEEQLAINNKAYKTKEKVENEETQNNETIDWPQNDLIELIKRIETAIPEKDNLAYSTRAEKLNWDDIAFRNYTGSECKKTWQLIQKRVRRFRLLGEVIQDAKEWIWKPWTNFYRGNKTKRHPDMPRRPLSVYMLFYLNKKDKILAENPGMEMTEVSKKIALMYKSISPAKREKYMGLAAVERKNYEGKLEEFYRLHPEFTRTKDEKLSHPKHTEVGPKKPLTPFVLFHEEQLKSLNNPDVDFHKFKEQCKRQWKDMSDKKKLVWIDWALDNEAKYQASLKLLETFSFVTLHDELKNYKSQNPNFNSKAMKPILTKEEKLLKERLAGKPIKPPNSAYSLFSRMMLQSEEIKGVAPKDRMKAIADQWKNYSEKEQKQYRERVEHLMEQYKLDFASYLESLPEDKRQEELQNSLPKRKKGTNDTEEARKDHEADDVVDSGVADIDAPPTNSLKRKKVGESESLAKKKKTNTELDKLLQEEPAPPPMTAFKLFASEYQGKFPAKKSWKNLNKSEKVDYKEKVNVLKRKYMKKYEVFLKALKSQNQLKEYLKYKENTKQEEDDKSDDDSDTSSSSSDSSSDSSSSSSDSDNSDSDSDT